MGKGGESAVATKTSVGGKDAAVAEMVSVATKYTWEEVKKHCTPDDAWIVYMNKVYDVSNWHEHPGGAVIYSMQATT
jgi:cytochrome b involved in lipid metabolism